jgi:hypothetical protein
VQVADGGADPYYGVFPLGMMDGSGYKSRVWREGDGFVGLLSEPFPLREASNDIREIPAETLAEKNEEEHKRQLKVYEKGSRDPHV